MSKRLFYGLFREAWNLALTRENILSAWEKTGLVPLAPARVLSTLSTPLIATVDVKSSQQDLEEPPTPYSVKAFRYFKQRFNRNPTKGILRKLFKVAEQLSAEREIANYRAAAMREALALEKKKRQRSKKLSLLGDPVNGGGQFFSSEEIQAARNFQAGKEAALLEEKEAKEAKKR
jgi:hypothetical protein